MLSLKYALSIIIITLNNIILMTIDNVISNNELENPNSMINVSVIDKLKKFDLYPKGLPLLLAIEFHKYTDNEMYSLLEYLTEKEYTIFKREFTSLDENAEVCLKDTLLKTDFVVTVQQQSKIFKDDNNIFLKYSFDRFRKELLGYKVNGLKVMTVNGHTENRLNRVPIISDLKTEDAYSLALANIFSRLNTDKVKFDFDRLIKATIHYYKTNKYLLNLDEYFNKIAVDYYFNTITNDDLTNSNKFM